MENKLLITAIFVAALLSVESASSETWVTIVEDTQLSGTINLNKNSYAPSESIIALMTASYPPCINCPYPYFVNVSITWRPGYGSYVPFGAFILDCDNGYVYGNSSRPAPATPGSYTARFRISEAFVDLLDNSTTFYQYNISIPYTVVINGQCGATENSCIAGTLNNIPDNSTHYLWNCVGSPGGSTASCSLPKSAPPGGICGPASGLQVYWPLDDTGTTAADLSGNGNNGNIVGATSVPGRMDKALSFDGINDYVSEPGIDLSATNKLTVAFWLYKSDYDTHGKMVELSTNYNLVTTGFDIWNDATDTYPDNTIMLGFLGNVGFNEKYYDAPTGPGWHHYTAVFDKSQNGANEVSLYEDCALQAYGQDNAADNTNNFGNLPVYLMSRAGSEWFLDGVMDDLRIYNRALTGAEIQQLCDCGTPAAVTYNGYFNNGRSNSEIAQFNVDFTDNSAGPTSWNFMNISNMGCISADYTQIVLDPVPFNAGETKTVGTLKLTTLPDTFCRVIMTAMAPDGAMVIGTYNLTPGTAVAPSAYISEISAIVHPTGTYSAKRDDAVSTFYSSKTAVDSLNSQCAVSCSAAAKAKLTDANTYVTSAQSYLNSCTSDGQSACRLSQYYSDIAKKLATEGLALA